MKIYWEQIPEHYESEGVSITVHYKKSSLFPGEIPEIVKKIEQVFREKITCQETKIAAENRTL